MLEFLAPIGGAWVRSQHKRFHSLGRELTGDEIEAFQGFYQVDILDGVRIHRLDRNQHFRLSQLPARLSLVIPFDVSRIMGMTVGQTVLIAPTAPSSGPAWLRLLFHELVHVVQYDLMGIDQFVHRYVSEWASSGFHYSNIPLEQDAWALDARWAADPSERFSVYDEVKRRLSTRRGGEPAKPSAE